MLSDDFVDAEVADCPKSLVAGELEVVNVCPLLIVVDNEAPTGLLTLASVEEAPSGLLTLAGVEEAPNGLLTLAGVEETPKGLLTFTGIEGPPKGLLTLAAVEEVPKGLLTFTGVEEAPKGLLTLAGIEEAPIGLILAGEALNGLLLLDDEEPKDLLDTGVVGVALVVEDDLNDVELAMGRLNDGVEDVLALGVAFTSGTPVGEVAPAVDLNEMETTDRLVTGVGGITLVIGAVLTDLVCDLFAIKLALVPAASDVDVFSVAGFTFVEGVDLKNDLLAVDVVSVDFLTDSTFAFSSRLAFRFLAIAIHSGSELSACSRSFPGCLFAFVAGSCHGEVGAEPTEGLLISLLCELLRLISDEGPMSLLEVSMTSFDTGCSGRVLLRP